MTVNAVAVLADPPGVFILILPVVAPVGTFVLILVAASLVIVAETPLKLTLVAPSRLLPLIVTTVPTGPEVEVKLLIVGGACPTIGRPMEFPSIFVNHRLLSGPVVMSKGALIVGSGVVGDHAAGSYATD